MALVQRHLAYEEGIAWLAKLRQQPTMFDWPMLLESGQLTSTDLTKRLAQDEEMSLGARFDIVVANPVVKFCHAQHQTTITTQSQPPIFEVSEGDPFSLIARWLAPQVSDAAVLKAAELPFAGGALGYFSYDLGREIEKMPSLAENDTPVPEMLVGIYDWAIVVDHHQQQCQLVSLLRYQSEAAFDALHQQLGAITVSPDKQPAFQVLSPIEYNLDANAYAEAFQQVKSYISAGDCYQINLAQRMSVAVTGNGFEAYSQFRQLSRAPFMAYLQVADTQGQPIEVLSMSPERFLQVRAGRVETRPIKGTRPRHTDPLQDADIANALVNSEKDRAENVMIVDLLRNDIGKVCEVGSVNVTALFKLQRFTNVHHMVSIIQGQLTETQSALGLLRACFPGGSITGAPKLRAMEIIESLEPHRRHVYCGSIGYIGFDGSMDTNIAIRTALIYQQTMTFYAGGGIVADSDCDKEYQETLDKASQFITLVRHFSNPNH